MDRARAAADVGRAGGAALPSRPGHDRCRRRCGGTLALAAVGVDVDLAPLLPLVPDDVPAPELWLGAQVGQRAFAALGALLEEQIQQALQIPPGVVPR